MHVTCFLPFNTLKFSFLSGFSACAVMMLYYDKNIGKLVCLFVFLGTRAQYVRVNVVCENICRAPVLEKASRSVWDLILDQNGLGKEINDTVERVFCQLSGCEPPLFPSSSCETQPTKEKEVSPCSSSKKRSFNDMSKEEENGIAQESGNGSTMPENVIKGETTSKHCSG